MVSRYTLYRCTEPGVPASPLLHHGPPILILNNNLAIPPAYYVVLSSDPNPQPVELQVTPLRAVSRSQSSNTTPIDPRIRAFRDRVRARDGGCVVTGSRVVNSHSGFDVAHIFPLAHIDLVAWRDENWAARLTDTHALIGESGIHSVQNGIMMFAHVHAAFDKYEFAINPNANYRITCFLPDVFGIDGRHMYLNPLAPANEQPLRELLLHHWQQAVLCNMKGRGPEFDIDLDTDEGGDVMGQLSEMDGGKVMWEMMMAERLGNY